MPKAPPLMLMVQLTEAQRRQIREQTGQDISAVPFETDAPYVWCLFGGLQLCVTRGVFVPAGATENLLHALLASIEGEETPTIIEVGTGSGALALAAGNALPRARIIAGDVSKGALLCARANRKRLGIHNVRLIESSLLSAMPGRLRGQITAIVGNVPYLPPRLQDALAGSFPSGTAIGLDEDGLGLPRQLATTAREFLQPGGSLLLQLAGFQWPEFKRELIGLGYDEPVLSSNALDAPVSGRSIWRSV